MPGCLPSGAAALGFIRVLGGGDHHAGAARAWHA
jgi:hypothetical protein